MLRFPWLAPGLMTVFKYHDQPIDNCYGSSEAQNLTSSLTKEYYSAAASGDTGIPPLHSFEMARQMMPRISEVDMIYISLFICK